MDPFDMSHWRAEQEALDRKRKEMIVDLAKDGYTDKQISAIFNRHVSSIREILTSRGITS